MKKTLAIIFTILIMCAGAQAQLLDSVQLAMAQEYTDLKAALENPEAVIKITLRKKKYKEFPKEVLLLKNLQFLDLSKNDIKEIPDSIVKLKDLQYLIISKTGLMALPKNIGELKNLVFINANQNELEVIPYSFGELEKLERADLWNNNLDYFPDSMSKLKNLKWMDLRSILIPATQQQRLQEMLPDCLIEFSPPCNCGL